MEGHYSEPIGSEAILLIEIVDFLSQHKTVSCNQHQYHMSHLNMPTNNVNLPLDEYELAMVA